MLGLWKLWSAVWETFNEALQAKVHFSSRGTCIVSSRSKLKVMLWCEIAPLYWWSNRGKESRSVCRRIFSIRPRSKSYETRAWYRNKMGTAVCRLTIIVTSPRLSSFSVICRKRQVFGNSLLSWSKCMPYMLLWEIMSRPIAGRCTSRQ